MRRSSGQRRNRRSRGEEEKEEEKKKQWSANLAIGFSVQSTSSKGGKWLKSILSMIFHKFYAMKRQASVGSQLIIPYLCLLPPHPNSEHLQSHFGTLANLKKWKCACICMHKISKLKNPKNAELHSHQRAEFLMATCARLIFIMIFKTAKVQSRQWAGFLFLMWKIPNLKNTEFLNGSWWGKC